MNALLKAMRRAATARRLLAQAETEETAARADLRGVSRALVEGKDDGEGVARGLIAGRRRLEHARSVLALATESFHEANDALALALFASRGLDPTGEVTESSLKITLRALRGGRS